MLYQLSYPDICPLNYPYFRAKIKLHRVGSRCGVPLSYPPGIRYTFFMTEKRTKEDIESEILATEAEMADPSFWQNKAGAQETLQKYQALKEELSGVGKYDKGEAIVSILAGAGGDDAEDFAAMLFRMYQKFAETRGWSLALVHENENEHGGFRNITFEISAKGAYGSLKNEAGVHRLVRLSPFNANSLRHTSFALVEVLPKIKDNESVVAIPETDLRVEFSRAGGPGGQNVNKRETAVRVVHIPTNIAVHCNAERTQEANKRKALQILQGKLFRLMEEKRVKEIESMQLGKTTAIEWGNQIRSYVLHPYKMVKDHRTNAETSDVEAVLERGELDIFLEAEKGL